LKARFAGYFRQVAANAQSCSTFFTIFYKRKVGFALILTRIFIFFGKSVSKADVNGDKRDADCETEF
jgi:hypothetical protein